jgi:hypothetical protein
LEIAMPNASVPAAAAGLPGLSRRALFGAAPAVLLAGSAVAAPASRLHHLIAAHRAAWEANEEAHRRETEAMLGCTFEDECVSYGRSASSKQPLFVHSEQEIVEISYPMFGAAGAISGKPSRAESQRLKWVESKTAELRAIVARNEMAAERGGLTAAEKLAVASDDAEHSARIDLILYQPLTTTEAEARWTYMASSPAFHRGLSIDCRRFVIALFDRLEINQSEVLPRW